MILDLTIMFAYFIVYVFSKRNCKPTSLILLTWFTISFIVACFQMVATITFSIYWSLAIIACILIAIRGSAIVLVGMIAMVLLQLGLVVDAFMTDEPTDFYLNYGTLATLLNIILIILTFIHGRGLDCVGSDSVYISGHSNRNSH